MKSRIALVAVIALIMGSGVGFAQSKNCGVVGTWTHWEDFAWVGVVSPGMNATVGQIDMEWILWDPTIGGAHPLLTTAVRTTGPKGVWEKVNEREYKYTWVAYGLNAAGALVYALRAVGVGTIAGCDRFDITGRLQLFAPNQNIWTDEPVLWVPIDEFATRMPLVVVQ